MELLKRILLPACFYEYHVFIKTVKYLPYSHGEFAKNCLSTMPDSCFTGDFYRKILKIVFESIT